MDHPVSPHVNLEPFFILTQMLNVSATALGASIVEPLDDDATLTLLPVTALQSPLAVTKVMTSQGPAVVALNFDKEGTDLEEIGAEINEGGD